MRQSLLIGKGYLYVVSINKMKDEEVNRIIAEFMGVDWSFWEKAMESPYFEGFGQNGKHYKKPFTKSLDALVPVWEKLKDKGVYINQVRNRLTFDFCLFSEKPSEEYTTFDPFYFYECLDAPTIQQAAAHATAMAILELKK